MSKKIIKILNIVMIILVLSLIFNCFISYASNPVDRFQGNSDLVGERNY